MTEFLARDAGALVITADYWHARENQARRARCSLRIDDTRRRSQVDGLVEAVLRAL